MHPVLPEHQDFDPERVMDNFDICWDYNMNAMKLRAFTTAILMTCYCSSTLAEDARQPYVRLAELEIVATQLDGFKAAVTEEIEAAVRVEPGVLVLYAVFEKENPARVRVFEMYADAHAYQTHLETPHFLKFRAATEKMIVSRKLLDAIPIALGAKAK